MFEFLLRFGYANTHKQNEWVCWEEGVTKSMPPGSTEGTDGSPGFTLIIITYILNTWYK